MYQGRRQKIETTPEMKRGNVLLGTNGYFCAIG